MYKMRKITKNEETVELEFGRVLAGYTLTNSDKIIIPSVLSNPFFKGISIVNLPKKLKGVRSNENLNDLLKPVVVHTGISIELDTLETIQLVPNEKLIQEQHLLSVNTSSDGQNIDISFINIGINDVVIEAGQFVATALIMPTVK